MLSNILLTMARRAIALVMLSVATGGISAAEPDPSTAFPGVLPRPKEYREAGRPLLVAPVGRTIDLKVYGNHPVLVTGRQQLLDRLRHLGASAATAEQDAAISVGAAQDWPAPGSADRRAPTPPAGSQGYTLLVSPGTAANEARVDISGTDVLGAYYGIQTLIQLLNRTPEGVTVRHAQVRDWPTFTFRSFKGQCWYYRDNRMYAMWAPRFKWNVFGPCYTDCPDWRSPPETYRTMIADLCATASGTGVIRVMQLGNPYMLREKAIRATADGDIETLAAFFELSLSRGSDVLMLCLDDFAYLPQEDAPRFGSLAAANSSIVTRFAERIRARHPGTRILVCPPPYWLTANKAKNYEWAHDYLRDFCNHIPRDISIVWTGRDVTTPCQQAPDIQAYQDLVGRERHLFLWDNTLKLPPGWDNVFRMNPFLATCDDIAASAWPTMAAFTRGEAVINTYGPGEIYKVPLMTAADYLWNPEQYDPKDSLRRAMYWFDENPAVGPLVHRWVNDLHQQLFTKRQQFFRNPSADGLAEIRKLTDEYEREFDRIAAATKNKELLATLRPYLRRHTGAVEVLAHMQAAWHVRQTDPAEAGRRIEKARAEMAALAEELRKGDIAGDHRGCVRPDLEDQTRKAIDALLAPAGPTKH